MTIIKYFNVIFQSIILSIFLFSKEEVKAGQACDTVKIAKVFSQTKKDWILEKVKDIKDINTQAELLLSSLDNEQIQVALANGKINQEQKKAIFRLKRIRAKRARVKGEIGESKAPISTKAKDRAAVQIESQAVIQAAKATAIKSGYLEGNKFTETIDKVTGIIIYKKKLDSVGSSVSYKYDPVNKRISNTAINIHPSNKGKKFSTAAWAEVIERHDVSSISATIEKDNLAVAYQAVRCGYPMSQAIMCTPAFQVRAKLGFGSIEGAGLSDCNHMQGFLDVKKGIAKYPGQLKTVCEMIKTKKLTSPCPENLRSKYFKDEYSLSDQQYADLFTTEHFSNPHSDSFQQWFAVFEEWGFDDY